MADPGRPEDHKRLTPPLCVTQGHYVGCLLGGSVGDALGASIEFMSLAAIRKRFGRDGLTDYAPAYGRHGAITDDTQMTLFTAEGLLEAGAPALCATGQSQVVVEAVHRAYLRWLHTQGTAWNEQRMGEHEGLVRIAGLKTRRAPGNTCLGALEASLTAEGPTPLHSKGCGGVMRVAPVALARPPVPFELGCQLAAITHGHPSGYLPAGFLAQLLGDLAEGAKLTDAIDQGLERLVDEDGHEETEAVIRKALVLARTGRGTAEELEALGQGWVGHEALAIALCCVLRATSFAEGVLSAVNHGGDSDSTGSIAGNLLGLMYGVDGIPGPWLKRLELRDVVEGIASDLWRCFGAPGSGS